RQVGHRNESRRSAAAIDVLAPDIERRREQRAFAPAKASFAPALVPDERLSFAVENVKDFFEQIALRSCTAAGGDFTDIRRIGSFRPLHGDVRAANAEAFPVAEGNLTEIGHGVAGVNRNSLRLDELTVRSLLAVRLNAKRSAIRTNGIQNGFHCRPA